MVDKIVTLENNNNYLILDKTVLNTVTYYFGVRLNELEEPTNNYLFFEETVDDKDTYLGIVDDENVKGLLLTAFTANFVNMTYDKALED